MKYHMREGQEESERQKEKQTSLVCLMCHYESYLEGLDERLSGCIMRTLLTG